MVVVTRFECMSGILDCPLRKGEFDYVNYTSIKWCPILVLKAILGTRDLIEKSNYIRKVTGLGFAFQKKIELIYPKMSVCSRI